MKNLNFSMRMTQVHACPLASLRCRRANCVHANGIKIAQVFIFSIIIFGFLIISFPVKAQDTVTINFKVAAYDQVLFNGRIEVSPCLNSNDASSTELTINGWCAVSQLAASQGWILNSAWYPYGVMLSGINQYDGTDGNYWLWFSNNEPGLTSLSQHLLIDGEKLLLAYGTGPLKISADTLAPAINASTTISASYFDALNWQWAQANDSIFIINGQERESSNGAYELWTATTTPYQISVKKIGYLDSDPVIIVAQLPRLNINLRVEAASSTLSNADLEVWACEKNAGGGVYTINGRCAIEQSGLVSAWTDWGSDSFLDSLGGYDNNQAGNGIYWLWFDNLDYGQTALNTHELAAGEHLFISYGKYPLRLVAATTTPALNATSTIMAEQFGFDSSWNAVWSPAASSTFIINGQEYFSADGIYPLYIATTSPYSILARQDGFIDSSSLILTGREIIEEPNQENPPSGGGNDASPGSGSGNSAGTIHNSVNLDKAVNFLMAAQNSDGSIGSSILYSDWAAIALAAYGQSEAKNKLKNYLITASYGTDFGARAADFERRAMALMALAVNPYNGTATDFISKIVTAFDGSQIGDPSIYNDDIFALFPLLKAGYSGSDTIIQKTINNIISKQEANGSWQNVDLTAAAVQALTQALAAENLNHDLAVNINQALASAKNYLHSTQTQNGGFSDNAISTSWAIQAVTALGEQSSAWENYSKNPMDFLASRQQADGGFELASADYGMRIWTTAYAIPAALDKTWADILISFSKPAANNQTQNNIGASGDGATSTLEIDISNSNLATTTATSTISLKPRTDIASSTSSIKALADNQTQATTIVSEKIGIKILTTKTPALKKLNQTEKKNENVAVLGYEASADNAVKIIETDNNPDNFKTTTTNNIIQPSSKSNKIKVVKIIFYLSVGMLIFMIIIIIKNIIIPSARIKKVN